MFVKTCLLSVFPVGTLIGPNRCPGVNPGIQRVFCQTFLLAVFEQIRTLAVVDDEVNVAEVVVVALCRCGLTKQETLVFAGATVASGIKQ